MDAICSIDGCDNPVLARGWCGKHYQRWRTYGSPDRTRPTGVERFWARVKKTDTCWFWTGFLLHNGYGTFTIGTTRISAHRFVYELLVGPIPDGLTIDHLCHGEAVLRGECAGGPTCPHRRCVNPAHLEAVTHRVNTLRGKGLAADNAIKTSCVNGHEFTPENTYTWGGKRRACRICAAECNYRYQQRKRSW